MDKELALLLSIEKKADIQPMVNPIAGAGLGMGAGYLGGKLWNWAAGGTDDEQDARIRKSMLLGAALGGTAGVGKSMYDAYHKPESMAPVSAQPSDTPGSITNQPIGNNGDSITNIADRNNTQATDNKPVKYDKPVTRHGRGAADGPTGKEKADWNASKEEQRALAEENMRAIKYSISTDLEKVNNPAKYEPAEVEESLGRLRDIYQSAASHGIVLDDYHRIVTPKYNVNGGKITAVLPGLSDDERLEAAKVLTPKDIQWFMHLANDERLSPNIREAMLNAAKSGAMAKEGLQFHTDSMPLKDYIAKHQTMIEQHFSKDSLTNISDSDLKQRHGKLSGANIGRLINEAVEEQNALERTGGVSHILGAAVRRISEADLASPAREFKNDFSLKTTLKYQLPNIMMSVGTPGFVLAPMAERAYNERVGGPGGLTTSREKVYGDVIAEAEVRKQNIDRIQEYFNNNSENLSTEQKQYVASILGAAQDRAEDVLDRIKSEPFRNDVLSKSLPTQSRMATDYAGSSGMLLSHMPSLQTAIESIEDPSLKDIVRAAANTADFAGTLKIAGGPGAFVNTAKATARLAKTLASPEAIALAASGKLKSVVEAATAIGRGELGAAAFLGRIKQLGPKLGNFAKTVMRHSAPIGVMLDMGQYVNAAAYDPKVQEAFGYSIEDGARAMLQSVAKQPNMAGTAAAEELLRTANDNTKGSGERSLRLLASFGGKTLGAAFGVGTTEFPAFMAKSVGLGDPRAFASQLATLYDPRYEQASKSILGINENNPFAALLGDSNSSYQTNLSPFNRQIARGTAFMMTGGDPNKLRGNFMGGGTDEEQRMLREHLINIKPQLDAKASRAGSGMGETQIVNKDSAGRIINIVDNDNYMTVGQDYSKYPEVAKDIVDAVNRSKLGIGLSAKQKWLAGHASDIANPNTLSLTGTTDELWLKDIAGGDKNVPLVMNPVKAKAMLNISINNSKGALAQAVRGPSVSAEPATMSEDNQRILEQAKRIVPKLDEDMPMAAAKVFGNDINVAKAVVRYDNLVKARKEIERDVTKFSESVGKFQHTPPALKGEMLAAPEKWMDSYVFDQIATIEFDFSKDDNTKRREILNLSYRSDNPDDDRPSGVIELDKATNDIALKNSMRQAWGKEFRPDNVTQVVTRLTPWSDYAKQRLEALAKKQMVKSQSDKSARFSDIDELIPVWPEDNDNELCRRLRAI